MWSFTRTDIWRVLFFCQVPCAVWESDMTVKGLYQCNLCKQRSFGSDWDAFCEWILQDWQMPWRGRSVCCQNSHRSQSWDREQMPHNLLLHICWSKKHCCCYFVLGYVVAWQGAETLQHFGQGWPTSWLVVAPHALLTGVRCWASDGWAPVSASKFGLPFGLHEMDSWEQLV